MQPAITFLSLLISVKHLKRLKCQRRLHHVNVLIVSLVWHEWFGKAKPRGFSFSPSRPTLVNNIVSKKRVGACMKTPFISRERLAGWWAVSTPFPSLWWGDSSRHAGFTVEALLGILVLKIFAVKGDTKSCYFKNPQGRGLGWTIASYVELW